jgi:hypothetical protein
VQLQELVVPARKAMVVLGRDLERKPAHRPAKRRTSR